MFEFILVLMAVLLVGIWMLAEKNTIVENSYLGRRVTRKELLRYCALRLFRLLLFVGDRALVIIARPAENDWRSEFCREKYMSAGTEMQKIHDVHAEAGAQ